MESQFNDYITRLHKQKNQSVRLLNKVKKDIRDTKNIKGQLNQEKKRQETFLTLLVAQEKVVKSKGIEEQEEFQKHRQKQMRALNIKNFVNKTRKIKVQNEIVDMLKDIKEPGVGNQSKVKYLFNENRITSRKHLAKPIFSGIGDLKNKFQHLHKKNQISYNLRELNTNLFFDDQQPF